MACIPVCHPTYGERIQGNVVAEADRHNVWDRAKSSLFPSVYLLESFITRLSKSYPNSNATWERPQPPGGEGGRGLVVNVVQGDV